MEVVLLVEDDDPVRVVVASYLEELGHKVISAGTPREALTLLNTAPQIDLLFTDVDLTGDRDAGPQVGAGSRRTLAESEGALHKRAGCNRRNEGSLCEAVGISAKTVRPGRIANGTT